MTQVEMDRLNLLAETVRLRRLIECEHEEVENYKKKYLDLKDKFEKVNTQNINYRKFFKAMNVDIDSIKEN